jgi:hypothetical protein
MFYKCNYLCVNFWIFSHSILLVLLNFQYPIANFRCIEIQLILVYNHDFCGLTSFFHTTGFPTSSLGFTIEIIMLSKNKYISVSTFPNICLYLFSCLNAPARTTNILLNRNDDSRYTLPLSSTWGKNVQYFSIKYYL